MTAGPRITSEIGGKDRGEIRLVMQTVLLDDEKDCFVAEMKMLATK